MNRTLLAALFFVVGVGVGTLLTGNWESDDSHDSERTAAAMTAEIPTSSDASASSESAQRSRKRLAGLSKLALAPRTADASDGPAECSCEADLARLEDELQAEKYGVNQEWPEPTPSDQIYHPEDFEANFEKVMQECGLEAESMKIDCDEPPCIATVRGPKNFDDWRAILKCPAWADLGYPLSAMVQESRTNCGDGPAPFYMISPHWKSYFEDEPGVTSPEKSKPSTGRLTPKPAHLV